MEQNTASSPTPDFHIPNSLIDLNVPLSTFLSQHSTYTHLLVSTLVFSSPTPSHIVSTSHSTTSSTSPQILLIQRAATERGFPNKWELPGGSAELTDSTILRAAARELFEETGLHVKSFVRQDGKMMTIHIRHEKWARLCFEVEVEEIHLLAQSHQHGVEETHDQDLEAAASAPKNDSGAMSGSNSDKIKAATDIAPLEIPITLNPSEHQAYAFASLSDLQSNICPITTPDLRSLILQAFAYHKAPPASAA